MGHMDGAHLWKRVADAQWSAGEDPSEAYGRAIHAANASLMANPEDPFMLQLLADSLWCRGERTVQRAPGARRMALEPGPGSHAAVGTSGRVGRPGSRAQPGLALLLRARA